MRNSIFYLSVLIFGLIILLLVNRRENIDTQPLWNYSKKLIVCAENKNKKTICSNISKPPSEICYIMRKSKINDEYKKSILLIYLKLYAYQMENYHQGYEVRESSVFNLIPFFNPIQTKSFIKIVGNNEFLTPELAYIYEKTERKDFLKIKEIKEQVSRINKSIEQINQINNFEKEKF